MVCPRCVKAVRDIFSNLSIPTLSIELGEVEINHELTEDERLKLSEKLKEEGFELLEDSRKQLITKIKGIIIQHIHHSEEEMKENFSSLLEKELGKEYSYLSHLFSSLEETTIEKYIITQKVERIKELIMYGELSMSEIAYQMGYSSVQYLSGQFKKVTGLTPTAFKKQSNQTRNSLDSL
ncbi:AraC family transcriptional regulator [Sediminitomix flava]|uniref:AraC family transcriptional regulator n=2 Tax=Sediminitomix flava TaxID=379075 RepID=A0A315Z8Q7_SEDFL|nr:AraC family transcriptional regulator [Sediminitomix flava]